MENEQDWKFDKKKASTALQELSCMSILLEMKM